jgi:hypothetical protein
MKDVISDFKEEFYQIIEVFFGLQDHYMHDDTKVIQEIRLFKNYLKEFNVKYPNFDIMLEEHDLTSDDLKILLKGYRSREQIVKKIGMDVPFMMKGNSKYNCMQVLLNYKEIQEKSDEDMVVLFKLAVEGCDINKEVKMPEELRHISRSTNENSSSVNRGMVNR